MLPLLLPLLLLLLLSELKTIILFYAKLCQRPPQVLHLKGVAAAAAPSAPAAALTRAAVADGAIA